MRHSNRNMSTPTGPAMWPRTKSLPHLHFHRLLAWGFSFVLPLHHIFQSDERGSSWNERPNHIKKGRRSAHPEHTWQAPRIAHGVLTSRPARKTWLLEIPKHIDNEALPGNGWRSSILTLTVAVMWWSIRRAPAKWFFMVLFSRSF